MAFAPVNPLAQIWQAAGLKYLLPPPEYLEAARSGIARQKKAPNPVTPSVVVPVRAERAEKSPAQIGETSRIKPASKKTWRPMPFENWPDALKTLFNSTARGQFAWTYRELGDDLTFARIGQKSADDHKRKSRGKFLRDLFRQLAFPAGTHCFWPVRIPETDSLEDAENCNLFWSALIALGCKGLIAFGSSATSLILPGMTLKPLSCVRMHGVPVIVLWDINGLSEQPSVSGQVCEYLRSYLRQIGRPGQF